MKAGIDCGTTFMKAVWKRDAEYVFASTKYHSLEVIVSAMKKDAVTDIYVQGINYAQSAKKLSQELQVHTCNDLLLGDSITGEIITQARGTQELLRLDGTLLDSFLLASIGTGTSYAFVTREDVVKYPFGNSISGGFMQGLARLFGVKHYSELVMRASAGKPLDLYIKDVLPEKGGSFEGDLVIAHFGKVDSLFMLSKTIDDASHQKPNRTLNDMCASIVHCVAVATIRDVLTTAYALDKSVPVPKDVVYVGSTIAHNSVLQSMLEKYTSAVGRIPHFPSNSAFALAIGAYLRADDLQKE